MERKGLVVTDKKYNEQIDNIAQLFYKMNGFSDLVKVTENKVALELILEKYNKAYTEWKMAMDKLSDDVCHNFNADREISVDFNTHQIFIRFVDEFSTEALEQVINLINGSARVYTYKV